MFLSLYSFLIFFLLLSQNLHIHLGFFLLWIYWIIYKKILQIKERAYHNRVQTVTIPIQPSEYISVTINNGITVWPRPLKTWNTQSGLGREGMHVLKNSYGILKLSQLHTCTCAASWQLYCTDKGFSKNPKLVMQWPNSRKCTGHSPQTLLDSLSKKIHTVMCMYRGLMYFELSTTFHSDRELSLSKKKKHFFAILWTIPNAFLSTALHLFETFS